LTGIERKPAQARAFLHRHGFKCHKPASIPGNADTEKQIQFLDDALTPAMEKAQKGETGCLTVGVGNITSQPPFVQLVVRLNDNGVTYPVQDECDCGDSIRTGLSPSLHLMMKKDASLNNGATENGAYPNPVSALYTDVIEYTITAVNVNLNPAGGTLVIRDTLPAYLDYGSMISSSLTPSDFAPGHIATGVPPRDTLTWTFDNVPSLEKVTVTFRTTPAPGVNLPAHVR
jgi:uncharacterized repeat protein (TIGR01451 family)